MSGRARKPFILWADVPPEQRRPHWRRTEDARCLAAVADEWGASFTPCYGWVKPHRQFCWIHDPKIQTDEMQEWRLQRQAEGRQGTLVREPLFIAGWVGEAEYGQ